MAFDFTDDARLGVIRRLYAAADRHPMGSERHEAAYHAVGLALSDRRVASAPEFLERSVMRDARRILRRRRRKAPILDPLDEGSALGRLLADGEINAGIASETPESLCIARDFEAQLRQRARALDPNAEACLEGLLDEEPLESTAQRLAIPARRVRRLRERIRGEARALLDIRRPVRRRTRRG